MLFLRKYNIEVGFNGLKVGRRDAVVMCTRCGPEGGGGGGGGGRGRLFLETFRVGRGGRYPVHESAARCTSVKVRT